VVIQLVVSRHCTVLVTITRGLVTLCCLVIFDHNENVQFLNYIQYKLEFRVHVCISKHNQLLYLVVPIFLYHLISAQVYQQFTQVNQRFTTINDFAYNPVTV